MAFEFDDKTIQPPKNKPGNPLLRKAAKFRMALLKAIDEQDIHEVATALTKKAKSGNLQAAKLFLSYTVGDPKRLEQTQALSAAQQSMDDIRALFGLPPSSKPSPALAATDSSDDEPPAS